MNGIRGFLNRPLATSHLSGWRWHLAVVRKWWPWYAFWLIVAVTWWIVGR